jgi:hypothetical protein
MLALCHAPQAGGIQRKKRDRRRHGRRRGLTHQHRHAGLAQTDSRIDDHQIELAGSIGPGLGQLFKARLPVLWAKSSAAIRSDSTPITFAAPTVTANKPPPA